MADSVVRFARFPTFQVDEDWEPKLPPRLTPAEEADKLRDEAHAEGLELGRAEGRDEGRTAAVAEWLPRLEALAAVLEQATTVARTERERFAAEIAETVPHVAVALARKVIERELAHAEDAVRAAVAPIVRRLAEGGATSVRVAPELADAVLAWRGAGDTEASVAGVTVHADPTLGRADWIIETAGGFLDGRLTIQLEEATRLLTEHAP